MTHKNVCFQNEIPATLASMGLKIGDQVCVGGNKVKISDPQPL